MECPEAQKTLEITTRLLEWASLLENYDNFTLIASILHKTLLIITAIKN